MQPSTLSAPLPVALPSSPPPRASHFDLLKLTLALSPLPLSSSPRPLLLSSSPPPSSLFFTARSIYNTCQDSLLATPLIIDLCLLAELMTRVTYREEGSADYEPLYSVLGLLSYMLKAPLTKPGKKPINSLNRQRQALEAFLRACLALQPVSDLVTFTQMEVSQV